MRFTRGGSKYHIIKKKKQGRLCRHWMSEELSFTAARTFEGRVPRLDKIDTQECIL